MLVRVAFAIVFLLLPTSLHAQDAARLALVIGNQGYSAKVGPLKNPHNDVNLIEASLKQLGFKVTVLKDANYKAMDSALKRYVTEVRQALPDRLDAAKAARGAATTILVTTNGMPWTGDGFRSSWRNACKKAGVTGLTFHDLRGSAITRLAVAGATVPEIATISGLSLGDVRGILDRHYLNNDVALAESAIRKLEDRSIR
jgi:hypothetical protein